MRPTTEVWKDVLDYEGHYQVSSLGRVKSVERIVLVKSGTRLIHERILKSEVCKSTGYAYVNLHKDGKLKHCTVHRLVALAFVDNPNNLPMVNHKDENRLNNSADNLEWITNEDNLSYSDAWHKGVKTRRTYMGKANPFYGKHHTDEIKEKCGKAIRGKIFVNDGSKEIAINPDELNSYLERGYKRGYIRNVKTK